MSPNMSSTVFTLSETRLAVYSEFLASYAVRISVPENTVTSPDITSAR